MDYQIQEVWSIWVFWVQNNKNLTKKFCFVEIQLQWIPNCRKSPVHNLDFYWACLLIEVYIVKRQKKLPQ